MTSRQLLLIAIPTGLALLVLFGIVIAASRREANLELGRDEAEREAALAAVPGGASSGSRSRKKATPGNVEMEKVNPKFDPELEGITRRQVLNRGIVLATLTGLAAFGGACLAFLWPKLSGGFGSTITAGNINEIKAQIKNDKAPFYNPSGRFYLMTYETNVGDAEGEVLYPTIFSQFKQSGLIAMYQKCPHLGCRVPWCSTSQWFECPCHGSKYNSAGEWTGGPAPRGMWHFPIKINGEQVSVDTGTQVEGPPKGTSTPVNAEAKGPHCVGL